MKQMRWDDKGRMQVVDVRHGEEQPDKGDDCFGPRDMLVLNIHSLKIEELLKKTQ